MGEMAEPEHYERVKELLRGIYKDTCVLSNPVPPHPLYDELLEMGPDIVPALLRRLDDFEDGDDMSIWNVFAALRSLTRAGALIPDEHAGRLYEVIYDWLEWGRKQGIDWRSADG